MNKKQKRLGNKGFSLVELIVVIAIMAILVAVLAPTLLSKIEDSREGTDLQALGELNTAVKEAILSSEKVNEEMKDGTYEITLTSGVPSITGKTAFNSALQKVIPEIEFKSKKAKADGVKIYVTVNNGRITTKLAKSGTDSAILMSNDEPFSAGDKVETPTTPTPSPATP